MSRFDTYIELLPPDEQSVQVGTFTYGYDKHIAIRGFQKLINKWAKAFLTLEGTDLSDRDYGTAFTALIGSNISSRRDIQEVVQSSVDKANEIIYEIQAEDPPDDAREILDVATLESLIFSPDGLGFDAFVRIKNQAGEVLQVLFPGTNP